MRTNLLTIGAMLAGTLAGQASKAGQCDRACLEGFVTQYLDALVAHNPFGLPLAPKVKFSENDQLLELGDGLWNTATGPGTYKLYVADPQAGQVGFLGTMRENGNPVALGLRLKIENRRISEIETLVVRDEASAKTIEALGKPDPVFLEADRGARKDLIAATNKYFEGIERGSGDIVPFDPDCNRVQNGTQTTNNPNINMNPEASWNPLALGCKDQINTKVFTFIRQVHPRRFLAVDEERGLVFGFFMFHIPGDLKSVDAPGHGVFPLPAADLAPFNIDVAELYKIRNGKIRKVEALQTNLPYGTPSPFFGGAVLKGGSSGTSAGTCDRACLEGFVNQYLNAMVAHDAKRLPVTQDVRFTENDVPLKLGEALWRTASELGTYKLYFADPPAGQVGFFGTIKENGKGAALALRLKIENGRISEAEQVVVRSQNTFNNMEKQGAPDPVLIEAVPGEERMPRLQLIATANTYFEAIEQGNGKVAPFDADCNRFENGIKTTPAAGCSAQLDTHRFDYIQKIYPRRFLVVDEERQNVFGFFMFNHPGDILWVNMPGQGRFDMPAAAKRPFNVDVAEAFKIKKGKIRMVEALMTALPYGAKSPFVPQ